MKLKEWLDERRDKKQFQQFVNGYSKGYQYAVMKLSMANGRYMVCRQSDMTIGAQYSKRPKKEFLYLPWKAGYDYGYTVAFSNYDAGISDDDYNVTLEDILNDVKHEYENVKWEWRDIK